MIKKIIMGVLMAGVSGALIFGAINRTNLINNKENDTTVARSSEANQGYGNRDNGQLANQPEQEERVRQYKNSDQSNTDLNNRNAGNKDSRIEGQQTSSQGYRGGNSGSKGNVDRGNSGNGAGEVELINKDWMTLEGTVASFDSEALIVDLNDNGELLIEGRAWSFAQESGFSTSIGNNLQFSGFYEGEDFEVGSIHDLTSVQTVLLRDENGRPMWAGNGRWN